MRSTKYGLGLAIAATCMGLGATSASAATLYVDDTGGADNTNCQTAGTPCATIGYAHGQAAATGDTISVAAGAYPERVVLSKSVRLLGAQNGVDARDRAVPAAAESVITSSASAGSAALRVTTSNVRIDGFTIDGTNVAGIQTVRTESGYRIANNIVKNNRPGLDLESSDAIPSRITRNLIDSNNAGPSATDYGILADDGLANTIIDENKITGHLFGAFNINAYNDNDPALANVEFTDNTVEGQGTFGRGSNVRIEGNSFQGLNFNSNSSTTALFLARMNGVTVRSNTFTGPAAPATAAMGVSIDSGASLGVGAALEGPGRNIEVTGNAFTGQGGLRVGAGSYVGTVKAQFNRIVATTNAGVNNLSNDARVDARNNWWGSNAGAPTGAAAPNRVAGDVDATPHLVLSTIATPDLIQTGGTSVLKADLSVNSDGEDFAAPPFPRTPVAFTGTGGTVAPATGTLQDGGATATYTAGTVQGAFTGTATVDGQAANAAITVRNPTNGAAGSDGAAGAQGPAGATGPQGAAGQQGSQGLTPSSTTTTGKVSLVSKSLKINKKTRKVTVSVSCPRANGLCEGRLNLINKGKTISRTAFNVRGGRSGKVTLTLSKKAYKALKKSQRVRLDVFSRDLAGAASSARKTLTLKK